MEWSVYYIVDVLDVLEEAVVAKLEDDERVIVCNLNDGFLVKSNVLYLEEHVLDDLLLSFVFLAKLLLGCLAYDPLTPKWSLVAYPMSPVAKRVPGPVVGESKEVRRLMEGIVVVEPVGEVDHGNFLFNLFRLAQFLDPDVDEFVLGERWRSGFTQLLQSCTRRVSWSWW